MQLLYVFQLPHTEPLPKLKKSKMKTKTDEAYEQKLGIALHFSPPIFFTSPDSGHLVPPIPVHSPLNTHHCLLGFSLNLGPLSFCHLAFLSLPFLFFLIFLI